MLYDVIIIGAGPSGLACAANIKGTVLIIDKNDKIGQKLLVSGGGKCNFTNMNISANNYYSSNKDRVKEILKNHSITDIIELLDKYNIKYSQKDNGKLFAENSSKLVNALQQECISNNVKFELNTEVVNIDKNENNTFTVISLNKKYFAKNVVIASGGKSYSHLGGTDFGLKIAKKFKLKLLQNQPALVGLKYPNDLKWMAELSGVSVDVKITLNDKVFKGSLLFAHYGITGPVVLNTSLYINPTDILKINFAINNTLNSIPKRVIKLFTQHYNIEDKNLIINQLSNFEFPYITSFGYEKAEVMRGGVELSYLNEFLGHNRVPGLYFTGEILDITGMLGGYNIHAAFASGKLAARGINKSLLR